MPASASSWRSNIERPKCQCFLDEKKGRGGIITDTLGSNVMRLVSEEMVDLAVCPDALEYVCASIAAGILMVPELHRRNDAGIPDPDQVDEMIAAVIRLSEQMPDIIRSRLEMLRVPTQKERS